MLYEAILERAGGAASGAEAGTAALDIVVGGSWGLVLGGLDVRCDVDCETSSWLIEKQS